MKITTAKKSSGAIDYTGDKNVFEVEASTITLTGDTTVTGDLTVTGDIGVGALEVVADPGDAGTITPPTSGAHFSCTLTSGTMAETRVLGTPARLGQRALVVLGTDGGGDVTMENLSGWQDGGTTDDIATFDDAGDAVLFEALGTGAATDWRAVALKGVALS